jgi:hypothetical protein
MSHIQKLSSVFQYINQTNVPKLPTVFLSFPSLEYNQSAVCICIYACPLTLDIIKEGFRSAHLTGTFCKINYR